MAGEKIMVVVLLLVIIFLGMGAFMFYLEKRLSSSEKKLEELEKRIKSKKINKG